MLSERQGGRALVHCCDQLASMCMGAQFVCLLGFGPLRGLLQSAHPYILISRHQNVLDVAVVLAKNSKVWARLCPPHILRSP